MWLRRRLVPDHKTIADFRKELAGPFAKSAPGTLCLAGPSGCSRMSASPLMAAIQAVNNRDKNFTRAKLERRLPQIEEGGARYLQGDHTVPVQGSQAAQRNLTKLNII